jgi:hypothetical protein
LQGVGLAIDGDVTRATIQSDEKDGPNALLVVNNKVGFPAKS